MTAVSQAEQKQLEPKLPVPSAEPAEPKVANLVERVNPEATKTQAVPAAVVEPAHEAVYDKIRNAEQYLGKDYTSGIGEAKQIEVQRNGGKTTTEFKLSADQQSIVEWKKDLNTWLDKPEAQQWLKERNLTADELRLETNVSKGTSVAVFDDKTETTTEAFQQWFREQPGSPSWASNKDAIVGPRTMRAMDQVLGRAEKLIPEEQFAAALDRSTMIEGGNWSSMTEAFLKAKADSKEIGFIAQMFESGKSGAGTISTGHGDRGGKSYGTYQLASKTGTLKSFLMVSGYGKEGGPLHGLAQGSPEFDSMWKKLAKDEEFGKAQHAFIIATHYQPQVEKLQQNGIDLSNHGRAVQEAIYSTSTQYGGKSSVISDALSGMDVKSMSDEQVVSAIQHHKAANVHSHFRSSPQLWDSLANRINKEQGMLVKLARSGADPERDIG